LTEASGGTDLRLFENKREAMVKHQRGVRALLALRLSKEIKYLKKDVALPRSAQKAAMQFGGAKAVAQNLLEQVMDECLCRDITTKDEFNAYATQVPPQIYQYGARLRDATKEVICKYHDVRQMLNELTTASTNGDIVAVLKTLQRELTELVPDNFMRIYALDRQTHLLRYMDAVRLRAQRLVDDFPKDRKKAEQIQWAIDELARLVSEMTPAASDQKRNAVEAFLWLVEEYKVSVFAQELKTAVPVSPQRLRKKISAIDKMV
jgi:ATP-dependent helicase HrpA